MIKTISTYDFSDAFNSSDTYKNNFTYEGKKALFEYLEEYEGSTGEQIELDLVALCCDYTEYESLRDAYEEFEGYEDEVTEEKMIEYFNDNTQLIEFDGGIIIQNF